MVFSPLVFSFPWGTKVLFCFVFHRVKKRL
nr:MAG TPA: hypothetical protein [Caudoviricetes sp.]